jgi:NAD(P)H-nitrite reductase large subunit
MAKTEKVKYLIIGNSAGGIGAAEAIREVDKAGAITIISSEPYPAYSRPLISEYLASRRPLEKPGKGCYWLPVVCPLSPR